MRLPDVADAYWWMMGRTRHKQLVDVHHLCLAPAVRARDGLLLHSHVPVRVHLRVLPWLSRA